MTDWTKLRYHVDDLEEYDLRWDTHLFVRNEQQVSIKNTRSRGRSLTGREVVSLYGIGAISDIENNGAHIIQEGDNTSSVNINNALEHIGMSVGELCRVCNLNEEKINLGLSGKINISFFDLTKISEVLGMDENFIMKKNCDVVIPNVRLRYYGHDGDEHVFGKEIIIELNKIMWRLRKLNYLKELSAYSHRIVKSEKVRGFLKVKDYSDFFVDSRSRGDNRSTKPAIDLGRNIGERFVEKNVGYFSEGKVSNFSDILSNAGVPAFVVGLPEEYSGMSILSDWDGCPVIIANNNGRNNKYNNIFRFTIAHETAHAIFDDRVSYRKAEPGKSSGYQSEVRRDGSPRNDPFEMRANAIAAELLMPSKFVRKLLEGSDGCDKNELLLEIVSKYGVSRTAARYKLVDAGIISENEEVHADVPRGGLLGLPKKRRLSDVLTLLEKHCIDSKLIGSHLSPSKD